MTTNNSRWQTLDARCFNGTLTMSELAEALDWNGCPDSGHSYLGDRVLAVLAGYTTCDRAQLAGAVRLAARDMGAARASVDAIVGGAS